jgi:osomolarity two-component system, sensor histidine kinase SLN1
MSGLEAVSRLRDLGRSDFVVGVTGNALLSDQEEYLAAGVDQCVLAHMATLFFPSFFR